MRKVFQHRLAPIIGIARWLMPLMALLAAWFMVFRILGSDWMVDAQYEYGIFVPLLVLGLLWKRWKDLPPPITPTNLGVFWANGIILSSAVILSCMIPLAEANPDWRILGIIASCAVLGMSCASIFLLGGWIWLQRLAFPLGFFLIAVPWPRNAEKGIMTTLVSWNTDVTIEIMHWLGEEAMRQGNLIIIPAGILGMEEGCSGIRSLQGGLMLALFFGEYFQLTLLRRLLLLFVALSGAMIGNIARSSLLVMVASLRGMSAVSAWHDFAGALVLLITIVSIVGCSLLWKRNLANHRSSFWMAGKTFLLLKTSTLLSFSASLVLLLFFTLGTESWFRAHERQVPEALEWDLSPQSDPGVMRVSIPRETLRELFNPVGFSEKWQGAGGGQEQVFYFRWPQGRMAVQSILAMHTPEVCLSSIGMRLKKQLDPITVQNKGVAIPFEARLFEQNGSSIYVFNAMPLNMQLPEDFLKKLDDSPLGRLKSLLSGRRNRGQRMVEIAFWNLPDEGAAKEELARYIRKSMIIVPHGAIPKETGKSP